MPAPNQIASKRRDDVKVTAADLLTFEPEAPITEKGLRLNINVAIQYIGAWLAGQGAVPIYNLMEDAATAEISRSQVWQWIRSPKGRLDDARKVTKEMVAVLIPEELAKIRDLLGRRTGRASTTRRRAFSRPGQQRHVRRVPDAAGLRAHRLGSKAGSRDAGRPTRAIAGPDAARPADERQPRVARYGMPRRMRAAARRNPRRRVRSRAPTITPNYRKYSHNQLDA